MGRKMVDSSSKNGSARPAYRVALQESENEKRRQDASSDETDTTQPTQPCDTRSLILKDVTDTHPRQGRDKFRERKEERNLTGSPF